MVALKPIPVVLGAGIVFRMYSGDLGTDVVLAIPSDLLNLLGSAEKPVGFKSLRNAWTDMATAHGRLMLTLLSDFLPSAKWSLFERALGRACKSEKSASCTPA
ncbi:hypothetical protein IVB16_40230 (plasmid) [Bradyrhizobium sp. 183]|uniref:hypothetical protein n=1 Tax=unclassified Bradyrhizobium TaxID=2631580 RepID=UPI001FFF2A60|nr:MULTISPECIES: hypothetical protein [unclassified Bradyrhizobium]UPJ84887.1 hypothetical protein IVB17_39940 [Bradyrhizobium sp. 184]UPJ92327.1 hypothetical protein IVB16_40230 [Bradyrhizobium sp. 183]